MAIVIITSIAQIQPPIYKDSIVGVLREANESIMKRFKSNPRASSFGSTRIELYDDEGNELNKFVRDNSHWMLKLVDRSKIMYFKGMTVGHFDAQVHHLRADKRY